MRGPTKKTWVKWLLAGLSIAVLLYMGSIAVVFMLFAVPTNDRDNHDPAKKQEMMRIILQSGNVAPVPEEAKLTMIRTEGGMFSRSFRMAFTAEPGVIKRWIAASKGIAEAEATKSGTAIKYVWHTEGDFPHAEADVDLAKHSVTVYVGD